MKTDIHPTNYRPVVFQDTNNGTMFLINSCVETEGTVKYTDGKEYPLYKVEISSASHPFFTGKKMTVDTAGRIEKFKAQHKKAEEAKAEAAGRGTKKRRGKTMEDRVNEELQKQLDAEQKKEDKLMAKIRKNRPKQEEPEESAETEVEATPQGDDATAGDDNTSDDDDAAAAASGELLLELVALMGDRRLILPCIDIKFE